MSSKINLTTNGIRALHPKAPFQNWTACSPPLTFQNRFYYKIILFLASIHTQKWYLIFNPWRFSNLFAAPLVFAGLLGAILISLRICVARVLSFCSSFTGPEALSVPWSHILAQMTWEERLLAFVKRLRRSQTGPEKLLDNTNLGRHSVPISNTAGVHKMDASSKCFVLDKILWPKLYKSENRILQDLICNMPQSPKI